MKKVLSLLIVAFVLSCGLAACKKLTQPVYEQTSTGSGQLNFSTTAGDSYSEYNPRHTPLVFLIAFIPGALPQEPRTYADYHVNENNVLTVRAYLEDRGINLSRKWHPGQISISAPLSEFADGAILTPTIKIKHLVRPAVTNTQSPDYREAEIGETTVTDTWMKIHAFDPENKILTGFFAFRGEYADSTGRVRKIRVRDGFFDVSQDQIYSWK